MRRRTTSISWTRPTTSAVVLAAAAVSTLGRIPTTYVADSRFEQFHAPLQTLTRQLATWDMGRGIGGVREDLWPGALLPLAALRGMGLSPGLAQHVWHGALIAGAGLGAVVFMLRFWPRVSGAHVLAGLLYAFNPFTVAFLLPSNLFLHYALAPWFAVAVVEGLRTRSWRAAAAVALLALSAGNLNLPALGYALIPAAISAAYVVSVERPAKARAVLVWVLGAATLSALVLAPVVVKTFVGAEVLGERVASTESPRAVSATSSWSESWRGLGFWLVYFIEGGSMARPQVRSLLTSWPVVLSSFAAPVMALLALGRVRGRAVALLASILVVGLVAMVGAFPVQDPTPLGAGLLWTYEHVPGAAAMRTTFKAGAALQLGIATLASLSLLQWVGSSGRGWPVRFGSLAVTAVFAVAALPFIDGSIYPLRSRSQAIPTYWREAASWLDGHRSGRVLVLPATTSTRYEWGNVGDDVLDALLERDRLVATAVPRSGALAADLIGDAVAQIEAGEYQRGAFSETARRFGIGHVLVRNDVVLGGGSSDRRGLERLAAEPGVRLVATFGPKKAGPTGLRPRLEVYELLEKPGLARIERGKGVLLGGAGAAWSDLALGGALNRAGPVHFAGMGDPDKTADLLEQGARTVISDLDRRRLAMIRGDEIATSHTLARGEDLRRQAPPVILGNGAEVTVDFGDARRITSSSIGTPLAGFQHSLRPANAFDNDGRTAWKAGGLGDPTGEWVQVELHRPKVISHVRLLRTRDGGRVISEVTVTVGGRSQRVGFTEDVAEVKVSAPRKVSEVRVEIAAVAGQGLAPVGLIDVDLGLDTAERVVVSQPFSAATQGSSRVADALQQAPAEYRFRRSTQLGTAPEEVRVHRRFEVAGPRKFGVQALVDRESIPTDATVDALLGGSFGAFASQHEGAGRGRLAVDGRLDTGWLGNPRPGPVLTVRLDGEVVDHVDVVAARSPLFSAVRRVRVSVGTQTFDAELAPSQDCQTGGPFCVDRALVQVLPVKADAITVEVLEVQASESRPFQVLEVYTSYEPRTAPPDPSSEAPCSTHVLEIDGRPLPMRASGTVGDVFSGMVGDIKPCEGAVAVTDGWHEIKTAGEVELDRIVLRDGDQEESAAPIPVRLLRRGPATLHAAVPDGGGVLVAGQGFDRRWTAELRGVELGPPIAVDGQIAWQLPERGGVVKMHFGPERTQRQALAVAGSTLALLVISLLWSVLRERRRARRP